MPYATRQIVELARTEIECKSCGAQPGQPCTDPPEDREIHGGRWAVAAMTRRRRRQAAKLTPEQRAMLASLPRVPAEEIEKCRLPNGGWKFTQAWFLEHGLPYPPPGGWRKVVEGTATAGDGPPLYPRPRSQETQP